MRLGRAGQAYGRHGNGSLSDAWRFGGFGWFDNALYKFGVFQPDRYDAVVLGYAAVGSFAELYIPLPAFWARHACKLVSVPFMGSKNVRGGSYIHAGVLKKFGLYMLLQVALPLLPAAAKDWAGVLAALALCNVVVIGLITMAQRDVKMMVSYSSVSHMGICFLGIASMSVLGAGGAVLMMFGHGLSVALLFMLSNALVNRLNQWNMLWMGGVYSKMPVFACFFVAAILATIGLPGFANFWGELSVLLAIWKFSPVVCAVGALGLIISAIYGLRAVAWIFMGKPDKRLIEAEPVYEDLTWQERIPAILLIAALVFVGVFPDSITSGLNDVLGSIGAYATNIK